jgi:hypothetical protein
VSLRLGPYPPETTEVTVQVNGEKRTLKTFRSGDSSWVWIKGLPNLREIEVR